MLLDWCCDVKKLHGLLALKDSNDLAWHKIEVGKRGSEKDLGSISFNFSDLDQLFSRMLYLSPKKLKVTKILKFWHLEWI